MAIKLPPLILAVIFLIGLHNGSKFCGAFRVEILTTSNAHHNGPDEDAIDLSEVADYQPGNNLVQGLPKSKMKVINNHPSKNISQLEDDLEILSFTNHLLKSIDKRTSYANTLEEIYGLEEKESIGFQGHEQGKNGLIRKRNDQTEYHSGGCEAKKMWVSLGSDHFPRFVKSYNCTSNSCIRNLGECRAKSYSIKVLRMNAPNNISVLDEGCDPHLPEKLRCDWKLVPIVVTTYCECFSGLSPFSR